MFDLIKDLIYGKRVARELKNMGVNAALPWTGGRGGQIVRTGRKLGDDPKETARALLAFHRGEYEEYIIAKIKARRG